MTACAGVGSAAAVGRDEQTDHEQRSECAHPRPESPNTPQFCPHREPLSHTIPTRTISRFARRFRVDSVDRGPVETANDSTPPCRGRARPAGAGPHRRPRRQQRHRSLRPSARQLRRPGADRAIIRPAAAVHGPHPVAAQRHDGGRQPLLPAGRLQADRQDDERARRPQRRHGHLRLLWDPAHQGHDARRADVRLRVGDGARPRPAAGVRPRAGPRRGGGHSRPRRVLACDERDVVHAERTGGGARHPAAPAAHPRLRSRRAPDAQRHDELRQRGQRVLHGAPPPVPGEREAVHRPTT